jgi:hypothetical protein
MNKKVLLAVPLLAISFVFAAYENNQNTTSLVEGEETAQAGGETEPNYILPKFKSMATPSFFKIDVDTLYRYSFDHAYTKICWKDCDQNNRYNHMDIHAADVKVGDKLQIDWHQMDSLPSEVNLIRLDQETKEEVNKENKDNKNSPLHIKIDEDMIGKQYAIEFLWVNEGIIQGKSILTYKFE